MKFIEWIDGRVRLIDQTRLPMEAVFLDLDDYYGVIKVIQEMRVRGAPAIGIAGAYAVVMAANQIDSAEYKDFLLRLENSAKEIAQARPTGVNLSWAVHRVLNAAASCNSIDAARTALLEEALIIHKEGEEADRRIGEFGAGLIHSKAAILTHCNTGALATGGYGTALGVVKTAWKQGKVKRVFACEARPLLQGSRLTVWELLQEGISCTLIVDSAAGYLMKRDEIDAVIVGADRIAANGDVANKIGTYSLAVLAKENEVPFYVAAPTSTIDRSLPSGDAVLIEGRSSEEVSTFAGVQTAPLEAEAFNPAFDVTPHRYVAALVTEVGVLREPYEVSIRSSLEAVHV